MKIGPYTPKELTDTLYVHLRPRTNWQGALEGMTAVKTAKTLDALVAPGDFIVKVQVVVAPSFFLDAMPSARVELNPGEVIPVIVTQQEEAP